MSNKVYKNKTDYLTIKINPKLLIFILIAISSILGKIPNSLWSSQYSMLQESIMSD